MLKQLLDSTTEALWAGMTPEGSVALRAPTAPWSAFGRTRATSASVAGRSLALGVTPDVLLVGKRGGDLEKAASWVVSKNVRVQWVNDLPAASLWLARKCRPSHVMVDIDDLGDLGLAIEDLMVLRKSVPNVAVILVSREFDTDDFDLNRIVLGDVCLRAPVNFHALEMAMPVSEDHNRLWQERRRLS